jgi:hypothetical protein
MIRRAYIRKMEGRLERLENDIEKLRKRVAAPADDAGERIGREIRDLRAKAASARGMIHAVEDAGASNWGYLKDAVDEGIRELGQAVDEAIERLRKTGSGDR